MRSGRRLRVLNLDAECLPGHWIGGDYVSKIMTAVAWRRNGRGPIHGLTHYDYTPEDMAQAAAQEIEEADIVAGHYLRGFDLGLLNGQLLRAGLEPLRPVFAHDTKLDLLKTHGRSLSQKNLAAMVGLSAMKVDVTLHEWEAFNTKMDGYREKGLARVVGDVRQNEALRRRLLELGWLGTPSMWYPERSGGGIYKP